MKALWKGKKWQPVRSFPKLTVQSRSLLLSWLSMKPYFNTKKKETMAYVSVKWGLVLFFVIGSFLLLLPSQGPSECQVPNSVSLSRIYVSFRSLNESLKRKTIPPTIDVWCIFILAPSFIVLFSFFFTSLSLRTLC